MMDTRFRCVVERLAITAVVTLGAGACSDDDPAGPDPDGGELPIVWAFDGGLDGWDPSEQCNGNPACYPVGFVTLANGMVILEGAGDPDLYNSSISVSVTLPAGSATLAIRAISSCTGTSAEDTDIRVTLGAGASSTVLRDWTEIGEAWETVSADISAFAGQQVAIYIDQNDNGEQEEFDDDPEALCIDDVTISD